MYTGHSAPPAQWTGTPYGTSRVDEWRDPSRRAAPYIESVSLSVCPSICPHACRMWLVKRARIHAVELTVVGGTLFQCLSVVWTFCQRGGQSESLLIGRVKMIRWHSAIPVQTGSDGLFGMQLGGPVLAPLSFGAPFQIRDDFEQSLPEDENLNQSPLVIFLNSKTQYWI